MCKTAILLLTGLLAGCSTDASEVARDEFDAGADTGTGTVHSGPATLPTIRTEEACESKGENPNGIVWARSTDAVVWGTIHSVRLSFTPAVTETGGVETLVDSCLSGTSDPALEIQMHVDRVLWGDVSDYITIRVGQWQRRMWTPSTISNSDDGISVNWYGNEMILEPGQEIGVGGHRITEEDFSLMGEPMFTIEEGVDGRLGIKFQPTRGDNCELPLGPTDFDGLTLDEVKIAVDGGDSYSELADARRESIIAVWGSHPSDYFAAACIDSNSGE